MFVVADVLIAAAGAMFVFVVVVALVFVVVCSALSLPLLKCPPPHHHHHQDLHNLKDGYNSMLNSLNFVPIILAPYVSFSLNWEKSFKISTES